MNISLCKFLGGLLVLLPLGAGANLPPVIDGFSVTPTKWEATSEVVVTCIAHDPEGKALTYHWAAQDGMVVGSADLQGVRWKLPGDEGNLLLSISVKDPDGSTTAGEYLLPVGPVRAYRSLRPGEVKATRMAVDEEHRLWVTDWSRARVARLTAGGQVLSEFATGPKPLGIAVAEDGSILVGEDGLDRVVRYSRAGALLGVLGSGTGDVEMPNAIAVDPVGHRIYVVDSKGNRLNVYTADGVPLAPIGGASLEFPADVAVDAGAQEIYVADQGTSRIFVFNPSGQLVRRFGSAGYLPGQFGRLRALELDGQGNLMVLDGYQDQVQLLTRTGGPMNQFGYFGRWSGSYSAPLDLCVDVGSYVFVTSSGLGSVESYAYWAIADPSGGQGWMLF